jgi:prophage DNA circulation protein
MGILDGLLLPASFRGVPFAVKSTNTSVGRRVALHQYPGRDVPWAEDLGRDARRYRFRGFLVTDDIVYLGGPVQLQRLLLAAAAEKSGSGLLTHPTLGILQVSCLRCSIGEELDAGRYSEIDFEFVESGKKSFPSLLSSSSGLFSAANLMKVALVLDAVRVVAKIAGVGSARRDVGIVATSLTNSTQALALDATALHRMAAQLPGPFGRYAAGGNAGIDGDTPTAFTSATTITDLVAIASSSRVAVISAGATLTLAVQSTDLTAPAPIANAVTDLVQSLAAACADPSDVFRLLEQLIDDAAAIIAVSPGSAITTMFQRAAAAALVAAVQDYRPTSVEDAAALMIRLADLLDSLATQAADGGDDESFKAIRAGRVSVVQSLRNAAGTLAHVTTFEFGAPMPALAVAQRLYHDPARADSLVTQVDPRHPLFLPVSFQALAA